MPDDIENKADAVSADPMERSASTPDAPASAPSAPAGWYPSPTGEQQYWDGDRWLDIPPPPSSSSSSSSSTSSPAPSGRSPLTKRSKWLIAGAIGLLAVLAGAGIAWKVAADGAAQQAAAEAEAKREADAKRIAENERAAQEREEAAEKLELDQRTQSIDGIEVSVKEMAEKHAVDGIIDGPILEVSCSPVDGGSFEDVSEQTTVFECFVANKDNGDGTMNGYTYNATMNWTTGQYTYGLGAP